MRRKEIQILLIERDKVISALHGLEENRGAGKVSKLDYDILRERYERRLKEIDHKLGMTKAEALRERKWKEIARPRRPKRELPERKEIPTSYWFGFMGLSGGILAVVSVFFAWVTFSAPSITMSLSGVDIIRHCGFFSIPFISAILVIIGGFLAVAGGFCLMRSTEWTAGGFLLPTGGVFILMGGVLSWLKTSEAIAAVTGYYGAYLDVVGASIGIGIGIYMCIFGAILALIGIFGLGQ